MHMRCLLDLFEPKLPDDEDLYFRRQALADNFRRGRLLAIVSIGFEIVFASIDGSALLMGIRNEFNYATYFLMYSLMIIANLILLLTARSWLQPEEIPAHKVKTLENGLLGYLIFNMAWGSVVTLMDQKLYGQLTVFMVNVIFCSAIFVINSRRLMIPYLVSSVILLAGLPVFQSASDVLVGHYVNLAVFISIAWLASRFLYQSYFHNLTSKMALERSNRLLADESTQNQLINDKLAQANFQLRQLSLVDELTGIANRRGLRNFINQVFDQTAIPIHNLAVMVVDIDHFKQHNDKYGHPAGDQLLVDVASLLATVTRPPLELVARWGGDEFIVLSFAADNLALDEKAETIRRGVEKLAINQDNTEIAAAVTVSIGTSLLPVGLTADISKIISAADSAMYLAKEAGRNKIWHSRVS